MTKQPGTPAPAPPEALAIIRRLVEGNRRFVEGRLEHPHQDPARRQELVDGQDPDVILVTCSDSRIDPEALFDAGLGDIFAIENAGGLVFARGRETSLEMASIEYMADHYCRANRCGVLLILAHTHCGAIATALQTSEEDSTGSTHLDLLVETIRANIPAEVRRDPGPGNRRAVVANGEEVLRSILERSRIVRQAVEEGHLLALGATYDLETGWVDFPESWPPPSWRQRHRVSDSGAGTSSHDQAT